jgi:CyaY protein
MTTPNEKDFEQAADATLHALDRALVDEADIEVELSMGILSIEFADGTKFVVNSHRAARQIWMAADRSAWHFDLAEGGGESSKWVAAKTGDDLHATLARAIGERLGRAIRLR